MLGVHPGNGCTWEAVIDDDHGAAGWKCTRHDGAVTYVYLVPSFNEPPGQENVFLYQGEDMTDGESLTYVNLWPDDPAHADDRGEDPEP